MGSASLCPEGVLVPSQDGGVRGSQRAQDAVDCFFANDAGVHLHDNGPHIRQILINIIGNAVKLTERGKVDVEVASSLLPSSVPGGGVVQLTVSVRDTGVGFGGEFLSRIFQPFSRHEGASGLRQGGTGLGLAISKSLAELMGGSISAHSVLNRGSQFQIGLPLPVVPPPLGASLKAQAPAGGLPPAFRGRVLVVEDNETGQTVASLMLQQFGLEAEIAANGAEALHKVRSAVSAYDMVLMDCQMAVMDGFEATRRIRMHEGETGRGRLPIIALSANVQPDDIQACLACGMDDFLSKPLRKEAIHNKLAAYLPHKATDCATSGSR